jgi:putative transposase
MIISLYAGGMTIRDIQYHLESTLGAELSAETISNITDSVLEEVQSWQNRPLDAFYPIIYLDAIMVKIRHDNHVSNRAAHIALGVDMDEVKHVLGFGSPKTKGRVSVLGFAQIWQTAGSAMCCSYVAMGFQDFPKQ